MHKMRLNATAKRIKTKTKIKKQSPRPATRTTANPTTTSKRQIDYLIRHLVQLFILTTTIIGSGIESSKTGCLVQAKAMYARKCDINSMKIRTSYSYAEQLDVLLETPSSVASESTSTRDGTVPASAESRIILTAKPAFSNVDEHPFATAAPIASLMDLTTLGDSSSVSSKISNSYSVTATKSATDASVVKTDINFVHPEGVADVTIIGHNDELSMLDKTKNAMDFVNAADKLSINAQRERTSITQKILSLSLLDLNQTLSKPTPETLNPTEKKLSSHMNLISGEHVAGPSAAFQEIGTQKVNAVAIKIPNDGNSSSANQPAIHSSGGSLTSTVSRSNRSSVSSSAKNFENKYALPKVQKTDAPMLNYIFDTFSSANKHHHHDQRYGPHFEDVQRLGQMTNMTVQAGSSIHLNCRISLLQDKTVSWVRRSAQSEENALDLLTVGLHTYTGDKRYKMEFQYPNNWRLRITNVKKDDEAVYECQISTHPPRVIQISLHVNAPKVMIVDEYSDPLQEKYYEIDSTLQLSCIVRNVAMTSSVVYWKHGEIVLNYDVTRGGVSVKTELMDDGANSTLSIAKISKSDSGNYTCSINVFQNFTIIVHILNGESFAELHHGKAARVTLRGTAVLHFSLLLLLLFNYNIVFMNR